ncbi:hypothetical protein AAKU58_004361, partial [Oxalobacteraceae bacterium GrIS 1.18]
SVTINQNGRSRSIGMAGHDARMTGHDGPEYPLDHDQSVRPAHHRSLPRR